MQGASDADVAAQLLAYVEQTSDLVGVVDGNGRVLYLNEAARKRLGVGDEQDLTTAHMFPPETFTQYYDEVRPALLREGTWSGELPLRTATGDALPMSISVVARVGPGGEILGLVTHGREIEAYERDPAIATLVHDELTGLPLRAILEDRIHVAFAHAAREGRQVAVAMADVDGMKDVNDSFGHSVGDDVLRGLARNMVRAIRTGDTVARVGGDEFVILLNEIEGMESALQLAERVRETVCRTPIPTSGGDLTVTASFGIAVGGADEEPDELLNRADAAMYRAKALGGGHVVAFDHGAEVSITTLADEFAVAVSHGLIRPHAQAVVDLETGNVVGYQGLARWEHGARGLLEAREFIDVVANTPAAPVVDLAVLRRTGAAAARGSRQSDPMRAYGHLCRRLIGDVDVERYLSEMATDLALDPAALCVEIAYPIVARHSRTVSSALRGMRDVGVRTVLSDVDGECDVNNIVDHGFDELRLSRRLVHDAVTDPVRRRVAAGTIALASALGLTVIAVGVETEGQREILLDAGCHLGEGYLFGPVLPAGAIN